MHHIVYTSQANYRLERLELLELCRQSSIYKAECDITGILVFDREAFMQVIEGEAASV
jgi:hypothetical protein